MLRILTCRHCGAVIGTVMLWLSMHSNYVIAQQGVTTAPVRVGVLYWSMSIPGQVAMRQGLEAQAARINEDATSSKGRTVVLLPHVAGDGQQGIERQIIQMYELIRMNPDVIIVQPTDNAALAEPLREANRKGIPVVAYDQYISGGTLAAFVTSDNRQAGYLDGEYIASHFSDDKILKLVLVEYPHVSSTVERLNGFLDALRDHGQRYVILKTYKAVQPEEGRKAGRDILRDFPAPASIDVIFTVNDGGGLSVVDLLAEAGRSEIVVASIDGDPASVRNIRERRLTRIDAAQFCGPLGAEAMRVGYAVATGQETAKHILVPVFPITKETLERYPGWLGPIPKAFHKPWGARKPVWEGEMVNDQ
jgi:ribose transport system substrate-binding protein